MSYSQEEKLEICSTNFKGSLETIINVSIEMYKKQFPGDYLKRTRPLSRYLKTFKYHRVEKFERYVGVFEKIYKGVESRIEQDVWLKNTM